MDQFQEPLEQLKDFFINIAQAVVLTQDKLDLLSFNSGLAEPQPGINALSYAIPKTNVDLKFGLDVSQGKRVMIPFFNQKGRREHHAHRLNFSLVAVPEPPSALRSGDTPALAGLTARLIQPDFLIPPAAQDELYMRLAQAMKNGDWDFAFPEHGDKPEQSEVNKEAGRILEAMEPDNPERGLVLFKLNTQPLSYLIVRVTDKSEKDGLFVLTPDEDPQVMIHSFENDGVKNIVYRGLHDFTLAVRRWQAGAPPAQTAFPLPDPSAQEPDNTAAQLGLLALSKFTYNLAVGYMAGLDYLSRLDTDASHAKIYPSYYDLTGVTASLSYSVYYDEQAQQMRFSFGPLKRPDGADVEEGTSIIESNASVRVYRSNDAPQIDVELVMPEFVLAENARRIFMTAALKSADEIADAFQNHDLYLPFLRSETYGRGALVFLSYKGKIPLQNFLVVWPGIYNGVSRDFLFTCELKDNKLLKDSIKPILRLEQELASEDSLAAPVELTEDQYQAFHNTFHAVRIWRSRMGT